MTTELICPITRQRLRRVSLPEARAVISGGRPLASRQNGRPPIGETAFVLLRTDGNAAYPIVAGFPVLLGPEMLTSERTTFDLDHTHYAEAYLETHFYDHEAAAKAEAITEGSLAESTSEGIRWLNGLRQVPKEKRLAFPNPAKNWLSDRMDLGSNWDCITHIGSVIDQCVLQIGGSGIAAIGLLLAGAREGWLVTPMVGEAKLAIAVGQAVGVRLQCIIGIGEEIPFADCSFDVVCSGGCVHHMTTSLALPEISRVLQRGGRFAASEPWRSPLYSVGTRIFGKREANAYCRPLTSERIAPLFDAFPKATIVQHGTLTRYPMLAAEKLGARFSIRTAWRIGRLDDRLCSMLGLRRFGSSVALLAAKK